MAIHVSFDDYLNAKIGDMQLINVDDVCMAIALSWAYDTEIPENIVTKKQMQLITLAQESDDFGDFDANTIETLKPVQNWLVNNICLAIQKKELKPLIIRLSFDGKVDSSNTYVHEDDISKWLAYRDIYGSMFSDGFNALKYWEKYIEPIYNTIRHSSYLLSDKINRCAIQNTDTDTSGSYESSYLNIRTRDNLERKVKFLEQQLHKQISPVNKHVERHAKNREQVLGAALSIIINFPEQCKNSTGKFEATKIRALIEEKALLFWPKTGEPILGTEKIEREIRKWINNIGE